MRLQSTENPHAFQPIIISAALSASSAFIRTLERAWERHDENIPHSEYISIFVNLIKCSDELCTVGPWIKPFLLSHIYIFISLPSFYILLPVWPINFTSLTPERSVLLFQRVQFVRDNKRRIEKEHEWTLYERSASAVKCKQGLDDSVDSAAVYPASYRRLPEKSTGRQARASCAVTRGRSVASSATLSKRSLLRRRMKSLHVLACVLLARLLAGEQLLARRKRYLIFPQGSNVQVRVLIHNRLTDEACR